MFAPFRLESGRIVLRDWVDADLEPFARLNADPVFRRYFPSVQSREQSDGVARRLRDDGHHSSMTFWPIEIPGLARFAGYAGLIQTSFEAPFTPCVEIGWGLDPAFWGQGYATEAARAVLRYGFETLVLNEIVALTATINTPSRRVMERLGMHHNPADDFDHPRVEAGHPIQRHVLYRLPRADWLAHSGG